MDKEKREQISKKLKKYYQNNKHPMAGKTHSEASKKKMRLSHLGYIMP